MPSITTVLSDLENQAKTIIENQVETNPELSEAEATVAVMREVDTLLPKLGAFGTFASTIVHLFITFEVPVIYKAVAQRAFGTVAAGQILAAQNATPSS